MIIFKADFMHLNIYEICHFFCSIVADIQFRSIDGFVLCVISGISIVRYALIFILGELRLWPERKMDVSCFNLIFINQIIDY